MKTYHLHRHPLKHCIMISSILAASRIPLLRISTPVAAFALSGHKPLFTRSLHVRRSPGITTMSRNVFDEAGIPLTETRHDKGIVAQEISDSGDQAIGRNGGETWRNPRSRWARRKHRKKMENQLQHDPSNEDKDDDRESLLNWESFEFGNRSGLDGH